MSKLGSAISQTFSKESIHLSITLDDKIEVFRGGGELRGEALVKVDRGTAGSEVEITLRGKEKSIRKKGPVELWHQHVFYDYSAKVRDPSQKVLVGPAESSIPFVIDLPELPSSSVYRIGSGDVGFSVQYKLTVKLGNHSRSIPVRIAAAPLKQLGDSSFFVNPTPQTIFSMKGTNQGSITVAAFVKSTNIRKGEKVRAAIVCRNDSMAKIQRVEAKIVELLNWGSHEKYTKTKVNKQTLVKEEDVSLPGLQKEHDITKDIVDANYRTVEEQTAMHTSMQKDLVSGLNEIEMVLPFRSRDTYAGVLVDVRHYLKITFVTRYSFFGAYPSLKIPLKIGLPHEIPSVSALENFSYLEKESVAFPYDLLVASAARVAPEATEYSCGASTEQNYKDSEDITKVYKRELEPVIAEKKTVLLPALGTKDDNLSLSQLVPMLPTN